jgi:hypothetical protein
VTIPRKKIKPYADFLEKLGVQLDCVEVTKGNHIKFHATHGGAKRYFVSPYSASCRLSFQNWQGDVKRWIRQKESEK